MRYFLKCFKTSSHKQDHTVGRDSSVEKNIFMKIHVCLNVRENQPNAFALAIEIFIIISSSSSILLSTSNHAETCSYSSIKEIYFKLLRYLTKHKIFLLQIVKISPPTKKVNLLKNNSKTAKRFNKIGKSLLKFVSF